MREGKRRTFTIALSAVFLIILSVVFASPAAYADPDEDLRKATREGDVEAARRALAQGADVNKRGSGRSGGTALMHAAGGGHSDVVLLLIEKGADVNAQDRDGATALMDAALGGAEDAAHILIESGAAVNSMGKEGGTPLMAAALTSILLRRGEGRLGVARLLIEEGADVNAKNSGCWPNWWAAAIQRHQVVLKDLTQIPGADIDGKNSDGWTALMYAARARNMKMTELLIASGADLEMRDNKGRTARDIAEELGAEETAAKLKDAGSGRAGGRGTGTHRK